MEKISIEELRKRITRGLKQAVRQAIDEHFKNGNYIVVMQNKKVVKLYPPLPRN